MDNFEDMLQCGRHADLYLPKHVVSELNDEYIAKYEAQRAAGNAESRSNIKVQMPKKEGTDEDAEPPATWPMPNFDDGPHLQIFEKKAVMDFKSKIDAITDRDKRPRATRLAGILEKSGAYRRLAQLPQAWRSELDRIEAQFPNFAEVIDFIRVSAILAEKVDSVLKLSVLLAGPPGTGKSLFAKTLGGWIGGGYDYVRFESAPDGAAMGGSSSFWSNTAPGKPFEMLTERPYANPTFFLDEIDKVNSLQHDPLGALYSLLEPGTASEFTDASWPFLRLDCSRINYIAACNETEKIPSPILSRLRRFDIPMPTFEQALSIASRIALAEIERLGVEVRFSEAALHALCRFPPRRVTQLVNEGLGRALFQGRDVVDAEDIPAIDAPRRGIGFLA